MITSKKNAQVDVFSGNPWEVASVKKLLSAAYIESSVKDKGIDSIHLFVPCESYILAVQIISGREIS